MRESDYIDFGDVKYSLPSWLINVPKNVERLAKLEKRSKHLKFYLK